MSRVGSNGGCRGGSLKPFEAATPRAQRSRITNATPTRTSDTADVQSEEILLEEDSARAATNLAFKIAAVSKALPSLPSTDRLRRNLLERDMRGVEIFVRDRLRPRVALMVGVSHQVVAVGDRALYQAAQVAAQIHEILEEMPGPRADAIRVYLGIRPKAEKPLNALINSLFTLPNPEVAGVAARRAALNRHSKVALAIQGAWRSGVPSEGLAEAFAGPGGMQGYAEASHEHSPDPEESTERLRVEGLQTDGDDSPDALLLESESVRPALKATGRQPAQASVRSLQQLTVKLHASPDDTARLAKSAGVAVCLVDRNAKLPELFAGVPIPPRLRHDRDAAQAWVRAAIAAAAELDGEGGYADA